MENFKIDPAVRQLLDEKTTEFHTFCVQHQIPLMILAVTEHNNNTVDFAYAMATRNGRIPWMLMCLREFAKTGPFDSEGIIDHKRYASDLAMTMIQHFEQRYIETVGMPSLSKHKIN